MNAQNKQSPDSGLQKFTKINKVMLFLCASNQFILKQNYSVLTDQNLLDLFTVHLS